MWEDNIQLISILLGHSSTLREEKEDQRKRLKETIFNFKHSLNVMERKSKNSWKTPRVRSGRDALAEGTAVFSVFVCFIFKHPEPLLEQHFLEQKGSRGGEKGCRERGKWGWKNMISPAMKVKLPFEIESSWSTTEAWAKRGREGRKEGKIYYLSRTKILIRKKDHSIHIQISDQQQIWNWACYISLSFARIKETGEVHCVLKGKKVPWSHEALNSYIPFIALARMTSPLIIRLSNPAACVRTVWGTKWNIYMPLQGLAHWVQAVAHSSRVQAAAHSDHCSSPRNHLLSGFCLLGFV